MYQHNPKITDYEDAQMYEQLQADKKRKRFWEKLAKISWTTPAEQDLDDSRLGRMANERELSDIESRWE